MLTTLHRLRGAGLVVSVQGWTVGFRLAWPVRKICLGDAVAALDGPSPSPRSPRVQTRPPSTKSLNELDSPAAKSSTGSLSINSPSGAT